MKCKHAATSALVLWLLGAVACSPVPIIEVAAALVVVDTFPGNGTTLAGSDVTHIDIAFSESVDPVAALAAVVLEAVDDVDGVVRVYSLVADSEYGEGGFDPDLFTLSTLIQNDTPSGALPDDQRFRLTIRAGLQALDGNALAADVIRRFATRAQ